MEKPKVTRAEIELPRKMGIWIVKGEGTWLMSEDKLIFSTDCEFHAQAQLDALDLPKGQAMIKYFDAWFAWRQQRRAKQTLENHPNRHPMRITPRKSTRFRDE